MLPLGARYRPWEGQKRAPASHNRSCGRSAAWSPISRWFFAPLKVVMTATASTAVSECRIPRGSRGVAHLREHCQQPVYRPGVGALAVLSVAFQRGRLDSGYDSMRD
ncbi:hypothetical protein Acor_82800 [Acrocarpospora corrugata]|uniref:Uncharacterized protein n=1 Tax=Acrocarpospora corrugata TaxID=35763 RepID=A0A5M3WGI1_9ACTN|nr:hypothetical protein Acor_82800 [Acrocarpospora corrugata]